jgi:substrate import-associated zinc metallohydrolase lipoprotein
MTRKYNVLFAALIFSLSLFLSCGEDDLGDSIFDTDNRGLDRNSYTYHLDSFLYENYLKPYNLQFIYRMQTAGSDLNYNLVPSTYSNAKKMAVLVKYLWFDVYDSVVDPNFLKKYGPRIIHLIGSPAYNPANGTMILGLAEGGIKVSLFRINDLNPNNVAEMNEMYFKTMHHEFAHILHQTKVYPKDFNLISSQHYTPFNWQDRDLYTAASLGFVSNYAGSEAREDFVEVIANYIVKTDAEWNWILTSAEKGWIEVDDPGNGKRMEETSDTDGVKGREIIEKKLVICRTWLADMWNVDLDSLRADVQRRQAHIDLDSLLLQIE